MKSCDNLSAPVTNILKSGRMMSNEIDDEVQTSVESSEHVNESESSERTVEAAEAAQRITREEALKQMHRAFRDMRICCE